MVTWASAAMACRNWSDLQIRLRGYGIFKTKLKSQNRLNIPEEIYSFKWSEINKNWPVSAAQAPSHPWPQRAPPSDRFQWWSTSVTICHSMLSNVIKLHHMSTFKCKAGNLHTPVVGAFHQQSMDLLGNHHLMFSCLVFCSCKQQILCN